MKQFLNGFKKGFQNFGHTISIIINSVLLLVVYLIGIGLTSLFAKIVGKHFIEMKFGKNSYWSDLNIKKRPLKEHYRQF
jgi:hypothetical protein